MSTQRVSKQLVEIGSLSSSLARVDGDQSILVVGSPRSVAAFDWQSIWGNCTVFGESAAHNPHAQVESARQLANEVDAKTIVAVGGASAIDLGKSVVEQHSAYLVAIPTTLGGSEMSRVYGSRFDDGTKGGGGSEALLPRHVCYDSTLLRTLPGPMLAASGINAWAHTVEAHYALKKHWLGKSAAVAAGRAIPGLLRSAADDSSRTEEMHGDLLKNASLAGFSLNACGMGLHHAICHVLGGLTGVGHASLNVAVLPAAVQTNVRLAPRKLEELTSDFGIERVSQVVADIAELYKLPVTLQELGVTEDQVRQAVPIIEAAHHLANNPAPIDAGEIEKTLVSAFEGSDIRN